MLKDQSLDLSNRHVVKELSGLGVADGLLKSRVELLDLHLVGSADLVLYQLIYLLLHLVIGDLFVVLEEELLIVCLVVLLLLLSVRFLRAPLFLVVDVPLEELAATGGARLHLVSSLEFLSPITLLLEASFGGLRLSGAHFIQIIVILLYELIHDLLRSAPLPFPGWLRASSQAYYHRFACLRSFSWTPESVFLSKNIYYALNNTVWAGLASFKSWWYFLLADLWVRSDMRLSIFIIV